ncbi:MAG: ABC transporter substrate-binding protein [Promethearchaeota archaeon]
MQKGSALLLLTLLTLNLLCLFVLVPVTSQKAYWVGRGREWYYDNLDDEDRQKIRQTIDYCIPRETIIEGLHHGYAAAVTSPIGVNFKGIYENSITTREYNTSMAAALLADVFELIYDKDCDGTNTTHTSAPYFDVTLIVPATNSKITQYTSLIVNALAKIGIEVKIEWWTKDSMMTRIFLDPEDIGYDSEHGGYDMFYYSFDTSPDPTFKEYYDKNCFPPSANCYWIEDGAPTSGKWTDKAYPNVTTLWADIYTELDPDKRTTMLKEYQQWCYDQVPTIILPQEMLVFGTNSELHGFDMFHGIKQNLANLTIGTKTSAVIAQPEDYTDLNPLLSNSYSGSIILDNLFCRLSRRRGDYNLSHVVPWLAESWIHNANYLVWDVTLRQGILWEDGTEVTADDIVFSYQAAMNESTGSPYRETLQNILGNISAVEKIGKYEVSFTLPQFYPYVETVLFGNPPILQKDQMIQVPFSEWMLDDTNINCTPIGCGAYVFDSYPYNNTIIIKANPYYDETKMGHNPNMVGGGNWLPKPTLKTITFKVVKEPILAVAGLQDGTYDIIDSQMVIQSYVDYINASTWGKIFQGYEWRYQELGINHMNPIFGMNAKDPREMWYFPPLDPNKIKALHNFFIFYIVLPFIILVSIISLQITQKRFSTFISREGVILWYFLSGFFSVVLRHLLLKQLLQNDTVGKADWVTLEVEIILDIISILIWPILFVVLFVFYSFPAIGIEEPSPPQIMGFDLWDLYFLSPFLIASIISLLLSELILRMLNKLHDKDIDIFQKFSFIRKK